MRNLSIISTVIAGLLLFASCDKSDSGPVMSSNPTSPSISAPQDGQSFVLDRDQSEDTLMTIEWTEPDYGFSSAPEYTIQLGMQGENFSNPINIGTVNKTSHSVTVGSLNTVLLGAELPTGEPANMQMRVVASLGDSATHQPSEPITMSVTPFSNCSYCPAIYVPGGYQAASGYTNNWDPATAPGLFTVEGADQYEGYVYINDAGSEFKFTNERNWNNGDWGDAEGNGVLEAGGGNIAASEAGFYKMNVDLTALTYTMTKTQWGLIGSATANGWDADQDMTYNVDEQVWTITTDLASGEMKFRANDAWNIEYGDNEGDGTLEAGGSNIAVGSAGNYTITLDLSGETYTYTVTEN